MLVFYLAILMCFPILGFLSRRETGSTAGEISAVQKPFEKMAEYLYRKLNRRQRSAAWHLFTGSSGVRMDLRILDASPGREQIEAAYFVRKIRYILLFSILAAGMALIIFLTQKDAGTAEKNRSIARNDFGRVRKKPGLQRIPGMNIWANTILQSVRRYFLLRRRKPWRQKHLEKLQHGFRVKTRHWIR
jgi:hypothetical protein